VTLGTGSVDATGHASLTTSVLAVGSHSIFAVYSGDSNYNSSTSNAVSQTVNKGGTTTALASSANPIAVNQSVTFTATVTANAPGSGIPTGTVTFKDGNKTLGTSSLNASGQATFTTSSLKVGNHSIMAMYNGNPNFTASVSSVLTEMVKNKLAAAALVFAGLPRSTRLEVSSFDMSVSAIAASPGIGTSPLLSLQSSPVSLKQAGNRTQSAVKASADPLSASALDVVFALPGQRWDSV
jgi:hypothetical protein